MKINKFSHLDERGQATMVDISDKASTKRVAIAESLLVLPATVTAAIESNGIPKGDIYGTARIAGIQAAKKCAELIPLCHPLPLSKVVIDFEYLGDNKMLVRAECSTTGKTGVEMEALTAASVAALTIYDMCKAIDKGIEINRTRLISKSGGKSGNWNADSQKT
ncbi:MAG: cyclic pyranopterin monophosphate synthase MoaC [Arenicellaceae bacterium]|nr:cyclic pyranopterin monophosphate synthase MoaC [Arenicellaceae bacterium]